MGKNEIMANIRRIENEIAEHRREWSGMLGTTWEREDWKRKQEELRYYSGMALVMGLAE